MTRLRRDAKVAALKRSPLFEALSRKQLANLARISDDLDVPERAVLCREGTRGREFFVIVDGEADVHRSGRNVATLGPGDFFGEVALIGRVNRTATVTAMTPLRLFVISDRAFDSLLDQQPAIERKLLRALARRVLSAAGEPEIQS